MRHRLFALLLCGACASDPSPSSTDTHFIAIGSSASTVTLAWAPSPGATAYTIERGPSGGALEAVATVTGTDYLDQHLERTTAYSYRVRAVGADAEHVGDATTTDSDPLVTGDPTPHGMPTVQMVGAAGGTITLDDPRAQITLPAGAVPDGTTITVQPIVGPVAENDSLGLEIVSSAGLAQPIDIAFALDDGDMQAPEQTVISVQKDDGMWVAHHRTVDMAAGKATATIDPAEGLMSSRVAPNAPYRLRITRLQATWISPKAAEVKVNDTLGLTAFGLFSDIPCAVAPNTDEDWFCQVVVDVSGKVGLWDPAELSRPFSKETLALHNTWPGYTRDWTVQNVHLGSSAVGLITIPTNIGATYMAPAVKPTPNPVSVQFTSVEDPATSPDHFAFKARARPSALTIIGGMGYHVAATFHADYIEMPCPIAQTTIDDSFEFDLAEDSSGELHVVGITNHPTQVSNERFDTQIWASADINPPPEVISVLDGSVSSVAGTQFVQVNLTGNTAPGGCHAINVAGMASDYVGSPQQPMVSLGFDTQTLQAPVFGYWSFVVTKK